MRLHGILNANASFLRVVILYKSLSKQQKIRVYLKRRLMRHIEEKTPQALVNFLSCVQKKHYSRKFIYKTNAFTLNVKNM